MAKVYLVELPLIGKIAALKLLDPHPHLIQLLGMKSIRDLFLSEAKILANLRHPNILEIWIFDEIQGKPFYVMSYHPDNLGMIMGETYQVEIPSRIIRIDKAIYYIRQILEGLRRMHHAGVIHRDIKPFNILLSEDETVKISDFGLSKTRGELFTGPPNLKVGSPHYAAPEQEIDPNSVDASSDLYSTGIILYRMLTGRLPIRSETEDDEIPDPSSFNPDLNDEWNRFILKCIDQDPQNRFSSAGVMLKKIDALEEAWKKQTERICVLDSPDPLSRRSKADLQHSLRKEPIKIGIRNAGHRFPVDACWRPKTFIQNDFIQLHEQTVTDRATGLIWEQSGSEYPVAWRESFLYIETLNRRRFCGLKEWRLPTIEELMTLLTETPHGADFCMMPIFDSSKRRIWSADRCTFTSSWYVEVSMGFISRQDIHARYYVKAVC